MKLSSKPNIGDPSEVQRLASDPNKSVYVSASAGTGKTKVLTDRFMRLMLAGFPAQNILCLTFTNSATNEMKERISHRLLSWNELDDADLHSELIKLTGMPPSVQELKRARDMYCQFLLAEQDLKISTVHGFCQAILAKLGLAKYDRELVNDATRRAIRKNVISNILENEAFNEHLEVIYQYYEPGYLESILNGVIGEKIKFSHAYSNIDNFRLHFFSVFEAEVITDDIQHKECIKFKNRVSSLLVKLVDLGSKSAVKFLANLGDFTFDEICDSLFTSSYTRKQLFSKKDQTDFTAAVEECENAVDEFLHYLEERKKYDAAVLNNALSHIAYEVLQQYEIELSSAGYMEFADIIEFAREHLYESENADNTLYKLDYTIDHILVDEAQDLSEIQWSLIKKVSEEFFAGDSSRLLKRTMFIVGDYKQSICGFQGASPEIFLDIYKFYNQKLQAIGEEFVYINMQTSFRSTQPVIDAVNKFFMEHRVTENYVDHISFKGGEGAVDCMDLIPKFKLPKNDGWQLPQKDQKNVDERNLCARKIAENIKGWLDEKRLICGSDRVIAPGDIMIILKKREPMMKYLAFHLKSLGVPVANPDRALFSNSLIINDLMCLARFVDYPYDDIALGTLLKSPIFALTEEEFYDVCSKNTDKPLYKRIEDENILKRLEVIQSSGAHSVLHFYHNLEKALNLQEKYLDRYGEKYLLDLSSFYGFVEELETEMPGVTLTDFIEKASDPGLLIESGGGNNANQVRIMTVHGSKGLQAPVVILADSTSTSTSSEYFLWYEGLPFFNISRNKADSLTLKIKKLRSDIEDSEDLRLLYVAMTRAENELYFTGTEGLGHKNSWYMKFKNMGVAKTAEYKIGDAIICDKQNDVLYVQDLEKNMITGSETYQASSKFTSFGKGADYGNWLHDHLEMLAKFKNYKCEKFNDEMSEIAYKKAMEIKKEFPWMFVNNAHSEVMLIGNDNGIEYRYKLDKLIIEESEIKVIDFKTDANAPDNIEDAKEEYRKQLKRYAKKLKIKYPNHKIKAGILWVSELKLMYLFDL